jgi:outer membrane protein assembly factor BamE (lipoprotein component of BamABCDE complex)
MINFPIWVSTICTCQVYDYVSSMSKYNMYMPGIFLYGYENYISKRNKQKNVKKLAWDPKSDQKKKKKKIKRSK